MSNIISYNSWENKAPFGAIKINQGVRISVQVNEGYDLLNLKWVILKEDKIVGEVDLIRESKKYYQGEVDFEKDNNTIKFSIDELKFDTKEECYEAFEKRKKEFIIKRGEKTKKKDKIPECQYQAMINWEVKAKE